MTRLNAEPAGRVRTMQEFFSIAHAIELDAAARYTEVGRILRAGGYAGLADLFERLAGMERQHVGEVEHWARKEAVDLVPGTPWQIPDTFETSPQDVAGSRLMTPYRALATAVRHEQLAFAFWTYVSAHAPDNDIRRAAERMALEELQHASLLRRERRLAYRSERADGTGSGKHVTLAQLARLERRLADLLEQPGEAGKRPAIAASVAGEARAAAGSLEALSGTSAASLALPALPRQSEADIAALAEYLAEAYLQLAESAHGEDVLATAQELAANAVNRLGALDPAFPLAVRSPAGKP